MLRQILVTAGISYFVSINPSDRNIASIGSESIGASFDAELEEATVDFDNIQVQQGSSVLWATDFAACWNNSTEILSTLVI